MAYLFAVVIFDFTEIMYPVRMISILIFFLCLARFYLNDVESSSRKRVCLLPLVLTIVAALLFSIFTGLFRDFRLILRSLGFLKPRFLGARLWFVSPDILYWRSLSIGFDNYGTIALGIVLIRLTCLGVGLRSGFDLNVDCFFDYLIEVIELPATLFHFYFYWGFQAFWNVANYRTFF